jgi:peptidoglycan/xylan/chitin deacetylase (PgdA/CDA1 family)
MTGGRSAILTYHSLDESGSVISVSPDLFRRQMDFLAASEIPVVTLAQAVLRPGSLALTFDDGFRNFRQAALPTLERHRFPATVFVVSGYCGGRNNWPSQPRSGMPDLPLMTWDELSSLPDLVALGAHTATHPNLARLAADECERELRDSQDRMQQEIRKPVRWFAYPYGASSAGVRALAGRYFDLAVGTSLQFLPDQPDPMELPRIDAYYLRGSFGIERLFGAPGGAYIALRHILRRVRS